MFISFSHILEIRDFYFEVRLARKTKQYFMVHCIATSGGHYFRSVGKKRYAGV